MTTWRCAVSKFDLRGRWALDPDCESASQDNAVTQPPPEQIPPDPVLTLTFGWRFLISGLLAGVGAML
jgi:hypothetical protein